MNEGMPQNPRGNCRWDFQNPSLSSRLHTSNLIKRTQSRMPNYNLHGLDPRTFQQLVQAIASTVIAPGVMVHGDGPDGARDASFQGMMQYPSTTNPWNGYLVVQAKFRQVHSGNPKTEGDWLVTQMKNDLNKFITNKSKYRPPEFYIVTTNISLTPTPQTGSDARARDLLKQYAGKLNLKGFDIWDGNRISRYLDAHRDIAIAYGGYILAGDVLSQMHSSLSKLSRNFERTISEFLQGELSTDQFARLREAGSASEKKTPLARVFVDLPTAPTLLTEPPHEDSLDSQIAGFAQQILRIGALKMDRKSVLERKSTSNQPREFATMRDGRIVLIGGPGQGKSTLGQFICQVYRAALLQDRPPEKLSETTQVALTIIEEQCNYDKIQLPSARRFPVRIDLKHFADSLAKHQHVSLLDYIATRIDARSSIPVGRGDLQEWLTNYPWLIVLDGLDEVPASGNRTDVLESISQFSTQCATNEADVLIIATSRPQGYGDAFSSNLYCHGYLIPLPLHRALNYAKRLVTAHHSTDPALRAEILARLERAATEPTTARLMRTPLQVTILAVLAELSGELPKDRWELFRRYYTTIFNRETQRGLALSSVLRDFRQAIDQIHRRVGLQLQVASETAGQNNAVLSQSDFSAIVQSELEESGSNPAQLTTVANQLSEAALDRLVFLVSPQNTEVGFEIRSLQEFMAAEALMDGSDEQIRTRLETISGFPYWRNVFLFAAGKCAAERRYLAADIVNICQTLNDHSYPPAAISLSGCRLALDLLEDDTFRAQPKQHRALAEIALKLVELPPEDSHTKLASVFLPNRGLEPIYESALTRALSTRATDNQLGAWITCIALTEKQDWARSLADKNWPQLEQDRIRITSTVAHYITKPQNSFLSNQLVLAIPHLLPTELLFASVHIKEPAWAVAASQIVNTRHDQALATFRHEGYTGLSLDFTCIDSTNKSIWSDFSKMPAIHPTWRLLISHARVVTKPTKDSFADELEHLSNIDSARMLDSDWNWRINWPLKTILSRTKHNRDALKTIASKIRDGSHEGPEQWIEREKKWVTDGITLPSSNFPLKEDTDSLEHAWLSFSLVFHNTNPRQLMDELPAFIRSHTNSSHALTRRFLSIIILDCLRFSGETAKDSTESSKTNISPQQLMRWVDEATPENTPFWFPSTALSALPIPDSNNDDWIEALNELGGRLSIYNPTPAHHSGPLLTTLLAAFLARPELTGLAAWLVASLDHDTKFLVGTKHIHLAEFQEGHTQVQALILRVSQGALSRADILSVTSLLTAHSTHSYWEAEVERLDAVLATHAAEPWATDFAIELIKKCPKFLSIAISFFRQLLRDRKSPLHDINYTTKLGLAHLSDTTRQPPMG